MKNKQHLRDYFPNFITTDSLFQKMIAQGAPWDTSTAEAMDRAYFTMYSGIKNPSEFVELNTAGEVANSITIAAILYGIYGDNWTKLWEAFKTKYTPIENYNMQETVTSTNTTDRNINRTNDLTSSVDGTETQTTEQNGTQNSRGENNSSSTSDSNGTSSLQHGEQIDKEAEANSFTYAFNSQEKVPTSVQIETGKDTHSGTDTTTTNDHSTAETTNTTKSDTTDSLTGTVDKVTKDTRADKTVEDTTDNISGKEDIQRTRQGNIGVTSTQELLQQEFELWKWNFFVQVFEDVDKFLVLSVYDSCLH